MKKETKSNSAEKSAYQNMVELQAIHTDATNQLKQMEINANEEYMLWVDENKTDYAKLQESVTKAEAALELIALTHPEWFLKKKSITTPYGTIKTSESSKLEIANEEATIILLEQQAERDGEFKLESYVRTVKVLDREALEKLDDKELERFRIKRVNTKNVNIVPAKVDLGKAVSEKAEKEAV